MLNVPGCFSLRSFLCNCLVTFLFCRLLLLAAACLGLNGAAFTTAAGLTRAAEGAAGFAGATAGAGVVGGAARVSGGVGGGMEATGADELGVSEFFGFQMIS